MPQGRKGACVGAKASQHFSMCSCSQVSQQFIAVPCVASTFFARHHSCACCPLFLAHWLPAASRGPHSRSPSHASAGRHVSTCRACGSWAPRRPAFSFLDCSVLSWRPIYPGQLEPTTLPLRQLAPVSCSVGLSPTLSCSISPVAPLYSFPTVLYPLSLSFSLSLSLSRPKKKGGSGRLVHLYPPRGSNHPPRDRRGVVYQLSHDDRVSAPCAPLFFSFVSPPVMRIFFRMGVCSAACRGTAQHPRVPGPPARRAFFGTTARGPLGLPATHACNLHICSPRRAQLCVPLPSDSGGSPDIGGGGLSWGGWAHMKHIFPNPPFS